MIAVNDCVCMDFLSLSLILSSPSCKYDTYIYIKRVNETEQEKARARAQEREKISTPINEETHRSDYTSIH